jgi:catechol 2,3-dioxygenase-like lactoylglutathione lyase family enzyme
MIAVDHAGFVVPDLEAALTFFEAALGFRRVSQHGPVAEGERMAAWFGVDPSASSRFGFVEAPGGGLVELLEWTAPGRSLLDPLLSDAGGRHLALRPDDFTAAVERLRGYPGVRVLDDHERFVYAETPIGVHVQIMR